MIKKLIILSLFFCVKLSFSMEREIEGISDGGMIVAYFSSEFFQFKKEHLPINLYLLLKYMPENFKYTSEENARENKDFQQLFSDLEQELGEITKYTQNHLRLLAIIEKIENMLDKNKNILHEGSKFIEYNITITDFLSKLNKEVNEDDLSHADENKEFNQLLEGLRKLICSTQEELNSTLDIEIKNEILKAREIISNIFTNDEVQELESITELIDKIANFSTQYNIA